MDITERLFFAGSASIPTSAPPVGNSSKSSSPAGTGTIYRVNLIRRREDSFGRQTMENIGGVGEVTRVSGEGGIQQGDIGGFISLE